MKYKELKTSVTDNFQYSKMVTMNPEVCIFVLRSSGKNVVAVEGLCLVFNLTANN